MSTSFRPDGNERYCRENKLVQKDDFGDHYPFDLNIACLNAVAVLKWLDLHHQGVDAGVVAADDLLARLDALPDFWLLCRAPVKIGPRHTDVPIDEERAREYVAKLREIALEAKRRGVKVVWS